MPQPFDVPSGLRYTTDPSAVIDAHPAMIAKLGAIALAWTKVESSLTVLLSTAMGSAQQRSEGSWDIDSNWVAQVAMESADTIRARLKIIERTLGVRLAGTQLSDAWVALEQRIRKRAQERNRLIHTQWRFSHQKPSGLIELTYEGRYSLWLPSDFDAVFGRIEELSGDLYRFVLDLLPHFNPAVTQ